MSTSQLLIPFLYIHSLKRHREHWFNVFDQFQWPNIPSVHLYKILFDRRSDVIRTATDFDYVKLICSPKKKNYEKREENPTCKFGMICCYHSPTKLRFCFLLSNDSCGLIYRITEENNILPFYNPLQIL